MRIGVLDNDPLAAAVVASLVVNKIPDSTVDWSVTDANFALEGCLGANPPDVLLTDVSMESTSGLRVTQKIRKRSDTVAVLCMTSYTIETYAFGAAKAGAQGICSKVPSTLLCAAITAVSRGKTWCQIDNVRFETVQRAYCRLHVAGKEEFNPLTDQETAVMDLIMKGNSMEDVARSLGIKAGTVRVHVSHIKDKFGAKNLSQAVASWMQVTH